jgi:hypothetical protein
MKIYVAGKFENKPRVQALQAQLMEMGHTISYDWTQHVGIKPYNENMAQARIYANNEIQAIKNSDVFIAFIDAKGTTLLLEIGAALMQHANTGKPKIYLIGALAKSSPWFFTDHINIKESPQEILTEIDN